MQLIKIDLNRIVLFCTSVIISSLLVFCAKLTERQYITYLMAIAMCIIYTYLFFFILDYKNEKSKLFLSLGIIVLMIVSGFTVNPIRRGIDVVYDSEIIQKVQEINEMDNGKWIVEELPFPYQNYLLMAGVPVINSTNVYPNLELWKSFDANEENREIYNRYAHIRLKLYNSDEEFANKFELLGTDSFNVNIVPEDLETKAEQFNIKMMFEMNGYYIYKINSK